MRAYRLHNLLDGDVLIILAPDAGIASILATEKTGDPAYITRGQVDILEFTDSPQIISHRER